MAVDGFWYRVSLKIVPSLYTALSRLLFSTCRQQEYGREHYERLWQADRPFIAAFWHYSVFYTIHRIKGKKWVAMVSGSDDAEYISRLLNGMGLATVRGSRRKGGLAALKEMMAVMEDENRKAAIVADGSQGPPLKLQAGAILLASKTGAPILPFVPAADRYWAFKSWDRTFLPKPFARLAVYYGEPFTVPANIRSKDLEKYRQELEERMKMLYAEAWGQFGKQGH